MRKFTKKAISLAVALFVTVTSAFARSSINANAATTSILDTTNKQNDTYNVTFTAPEVTKEPTIAPTVIPVNGPQVTVSEPNGTSYYEETNDTLSVVIDLAEGATSATYSIDNGPKTTITGKTIIKLGEGKIANSAISLKVTSTDGTTANTQEFTYYKKSKASENATTTTQKNLSASMLSLFGTVKTFATDTSKAKILPVHFKLPTSDWEGAGRTVYCYAYYVENGKIERPLGIWPGEPMKKNGDYYELNIDAPTGYVQVVFSSIVGAKGYHYYPGDILKDGTIAVEEHYDCNVDKKLPYGYYGSNPKEGIRIENEAWIAQKGTANEEDANSLTITKEVPVTPIPSTTTTPSATPDSGKETPNPSASPAAPVSTGLNGYFGASLSAPQYNTTKQTLSAVALNAKGTVTYSFSVDGTVFYSGSMSTMDWDASTLMEGTHTISAKITDGEGNVWEATKIYTIAVDGTNVVPTETPVVTTTPSTIPTETPAVTETPVPRVPTATAIVGTFTPSAIPTAKPSTPTATPVVTATPSTTTTVSTDNTYTVTNKEKPEIILEKRAISQGIGEKVKVNVKTKPNTSVSMYSKNKRIATIAKNGYIKGIRKGKTKIVITAGASKATIGVTVYPAPSKIGVTSNLSSSTKHVLKKGATYQIPIYFNKGAYSNKVTFRSSNKKVASVTKKGKISAKKAGKAVIHISSFNHKKASVKITVIK